jgi:tetratricopeptide (TPR) repeat protein
MKTFKTIVLTLLLANAAMAQNSDEQYARALKLKQEYKYKEALPAYQALLKTDSTNVNYLTGATYSYIKFAYYYLPEIEKMAYYKIAEKLAIKANALSKINADAPYVYAMVLGRINENASSKQKIANAKTIKALLDKAIELNPKLAGAYHILGRWHRTIANFGSVEKMMINSFYGGVPEGGSHQDAINCFMKAIAIEPKFMMHQYELAQTYYDMGKKAEAKIWAQKALEITPLSDDDLKAKRECEALLKKLN